MTQDQITLSLLTACLMKQHEALEQMDAMLRELVDRVDSVGDLLWQMDRRSGITASQMAQARTPRKRTTSKRWSARKESSSPDSGSKKA